MHYKKKLAVARFKNVQCVPRTLVDGRINTHYYHRPTRTRLPPPGSPEFRPAWEKCERQLAARQKNESAKFSPPARQNSESHSVALPVVPQSLSPPLRPHPLSEVHPVPRRGLSRIEAAVYLGISPGKFDQLVDDGRMPAPRRIDRRKVWDRYEIDMAFDALPSENPLSQASTWDDFRSP
jgi:excisionase family DNA binding protein